MRSGNLRATADPRDDGPRRVTRCRVIGLYDYVVADAPMDPLHLVARLADDPVPSLQLTYLGHRGGAAHADPDHGQAFQCRAQSSLGCPAAEKDLVHDQARAGASHGGKTFVPRQFGGTESVPDDN